MSRRNRWTVFLQNNKGSGKKISELSILYREANPRVKTVCNANKKSACLAAPDCTWVQSETKKRKSRGKRAAFCRGHRTSITERCTICGNTKQISDWTRHGCDKCLDLAEEHHVALPKPQQYKTYKDQLRTLYRHTDAEALGNIMDL